MTTMREFEREVDESLYQQRLARYRDYSLQQKADIEHHYIDPKYIKKDAYTYDINPDLKEFEDLPEVKHNFEFLISYRNSIEILMQSLQEVSHDFNKRISDSKAIFKNEENGNGDFYSTK